MTPTPDPLAKARREEARSMYVFHGPRAVYIALSQRDAAYKRLEQAVAEERAACLAIVEAELGKLSVYTKTHCEGDSDVQRHSLTVADARASEAQIIGVAIRARSRQSPETTDGE